MSDQTTFPIGLLRRLSSGAADDDELALLDTWIESEGRVQPAEDIMRKIRRIASEDRPTPLRRLVASLVGGGPSPVAAGVRAVGRSRNLLYEVGAVQVELEVSGAGPQPRTIVGQVRGEGDWQSARLLDPDGHSVHSDVDELGLFAFPPMSQPGLVVVRGASAEVYVRLPAQNDSRH